MSFLSELAMMTRAQREQLVADLESERQRDIDRVMRDLEKRLRLRRIATLLPAEQTDLPPSPTPGHVSAGAFHQEPMP